MHKMSILFFNDYLELCYLHIGCDEVNKLNLKDRQRGEVITPYFSLL